MILIFLSFRRYIIMAIHNDVSSLLSRLANQSLSHTYDDTNSLQTISPSENEEKETRPAISRKSFSGSGLSLGLSLASGKEIDLEIRINQAGGLSQLELTSTDELSSDEQQKLQRFLKQLSQSVDDLFSGKASNNAFKFANQDGIEDIELKAYQDDGYKKQGLDFEKEGQGSGRKIKAQWYEYDREKGTEDKHTLSLNKKGKQEDQTAIYGQMNYQWLLDQVDTAMSALDDKKQGHKLAGFYNSGIQALFSTAQSGGQLLQELGASAQQAKDFIGRSIKVLASEHKGQGANSSLGQQREMNGLPDFKMAFTSQRTNRNAPNNEYQLKMDISQVSNQTKHSQKDETYQTQNRRLRMDYQSARQKAVYEYTWIRDESIRNVFERGSLASSHYRIEEEVLGKVVGDAGSANKDKTIQSQFSDREDKKFL